MSNTYIATEAEWTALVDEVRKNKPHFADLLAAGRTTLTRDGVTIAPPPSLATTKQPVLITTVAAMMRLDRPLN